MDATNYVSTYSFISQKLNGNKFTPCIQKVLVTARFVGANVTVNHVHCTDPANANLVKASPTGTLPTLETQDGVISESNAISLYLGTKLNPAFFGTEGIQRVQVAQWVNFASSDLASNLHNVVFPVFGWSEHHSHEQEAHAANELKNQLKVLNTHLENRRFVVGDNATYADVALFFALRHYFQLVSLDAYRKNAISNITNWFVEFSNNANVVSVCGKTLLGQSVQKPPKLPKEEKKKEEKKEAPKATGGDDEEKPAKKPKNPLELLPETSLDIETYKREFMNSKDRKSTLENFWKTFDSKGWSFWWMQYQNLPTEGKVLFKTNNSASMFLQKLDHFRKWAFGCYGVYGVEGDYVCRGVLMWRGLEIPQEVKDHDSFEWMDIKQLDWEKDRAFIEEYWLNL